MTVKTLLRTAVALASFVPFLAYGGDLLSCEQQQTMCEAQCQVANINDDTGLKTCNAKCAGKRVSCSVASGAETAKEVAKSAKEASSNIGEKAKAFWEGVTE